MIWKRDEVAEADVPREDPPTRREERRMAERESEVTVVGQGARLEGTIVSAGSLRIDGQVKGQINADGDVLLTPQSQVEADIRAKNVSIAGRFRGNVTVTGRSELKRGGKIEGNITSKSLVIEEGGTFDGQSFMEKQVAHAPQGQAAAKPAESRPDQVKVP
jgi:cytoskeletal protein CcmA (bactofilin family)